jgi:hypothetical protein
LPGNAALVRSNSPVLRDILPNLVHRKEKKRNSQRFDNQPLPAG